MRIVIALGGNALGNTAQEQKALITQTVKPIAELIEQGNEVIIAHGNGPQIGMINLGMSSAAEAGIIKAEMPFPECSAMSQGYIGFHLQCALKNELESRGIRKPVATIVTQVLVDAKDKAFENPTKPIGAFYSKEDSEAIAREKGFKMVEDSGRGYRRVVASPKPLDIVEKEIITALVDFGGIVIAAGGGGIPVVNRGCSLEGVAAVIDKDVASAKLAELVKADMLVILTAVERVAINFGKPNAQEIDQMTVSEAIAYCEQGHFAPGSMLPKVEAAVSFARSGGKAVIASLESAPAALAGKTGTVVVA